MEKLKNLFKAIGVVLLVLVVIGVAYFGVIICLIALAVSVVYILISEYHRKPNKPEDPQ